MKGKRGGEESKSIPLPSHIHTYIHTYIHTTTTHTDTSVSQHLHALVLYEEPPLENQVIKKNLHPTMYTSNSVEIDGMYVGRDGPDSGCSFHEGNSEMAGQTFMFELGLLRISIFSFCFILDFTISGCRLTIEGDGNSMRD